MSSKGRTKNDNNGFDSVFDLWTLDSAAWFLQPRHLSNYASMHSGQLEWQYALERKQYHTDQSHHHSKRDDDDVTYILNTDFDSNDVTRGLISVAPSSILLSRAYGQFNTIIECQHLVRTNCIDIDVTRKKFLESLQTPHSSQAPPSSAASIYDFFALMRSEFVNSDDYAAAATTDQKSSMAPASLSTSTSSSSVLLSQSSASFKIIQSLSPGERMHGAPVGKLLSLVATKLKMGEDGIKVLSKYLKSILSDDIVRGIYGYSHVKYGFVLIGSSQVNIIEDWWIMPVDKIVAVVGNDGQQQQKKSHKGSMEQLWTHFKFIMKHPSGIGRLLTSPQHPNDIYLRIVVCWLKINYLAFQSRISLAIREDVKLYPDRWMDKSSSSSSEDSNMSIQHQNMTMDHSQQEEEDDMADISSMPRIQHLNLLVRACKRLNASSTPKESVLNGSYALIKRMQTYLTWWWTSFDIVAHLTRSNISQHATGTSVASNQDRNESSISSLGILNLSEIKSIFNALDKTWLQNKPI